MCGIGGIRRYGEVPITGEEITLMLLELEHRGNHATGLVIQEAGKFHVLKEPLPAWKFTKEPAYKEFLEAHLTETTETVILHTRFATTGNPEDNMNNHPIYDETTAIVHNGMIRNYREAFTQGSYDRSCECDSDVFRAILTRHGFTRKAMRELNKLSGSAAIACVSVNYPDKLLLARSGSPVVYGMLHDKFYWASEPQVLTKASRPIYESRGVFVQDTKSSISIGYMPDNTAWLIGPNGLEFHQEFSVCSVYVKPDYSRLNTTQGYHDKRRQWKEEKKNRLRREEAERNRALLPRPTGGYTPAGNILPANHGVSTNNPGLAVVPRYDSAAIVTHSRECPSKTCGALMILKSGTSWAGTSCSKCGTPFIN